MNPEEILEILRAQIAKSNHSELSRIVVDRIQPEKVVESINRLPMKMREKLLKRLFNSHPKAKNQDKRNQL